MKKDIKTLEEKLKRITGEDKLPIGEMSTVSEKKNFDASSFVKLAKEVRKILTEDANTTTPAIKS